MDNIYHRHLKLPFQIQKPLYFEKTFDTPHQKTFLKGEDHSNETITSWLKRIGCGIGAVECFYTPPSSSIPIHTDDLDPDHVKINMTWGPEGGVTRWWETKNIIPMSDTSKAENYLTNLNPTDKSLGLDKDNFSKTRDYSVHPFRVSKEEDSEMVFEANTNIPSLLNVGIPHSTYNPSQTEGRWTICFVPTYRDKMIKMSLALRIFKKFIINE